MARENCDGHNTAEPDPATSPTSQEIFPNRARLAEEGGWARQGRGRCLILDWQERDARAGGRIRQWQDYAWALPVARDRADVRTDHILSPEQPAAGCAGAGQARAQGHAPPGAADLPESV